MTNIVQRFKPNILFSKILALTIAISFIFSLFMPIQTLAYDDVACARKECSYGGTMCTQPLPAGPCMSGGLPSGTDCVCYKEFTLGFAQTVHLTVTNINKDCGGGRSGFFDILNPDGTTAYPNNLGGAAFGWSGDISMAAGSYKIDPSPHWGGTYCVEHWAGPPDCSGNLSISDGTFGEEDIGDCSSWRTLTFENTGNMPFTITSITSGNPVFELNTSGTPGTLDPDDDFDFQVRFCAPGGLTSDQFYSEFITVNYTCNSIGYSRNTAVSGTAHVPMGVMSAPATFNVGEADWTLPSPGNRTEASLSISNVGDAPMNVTLTITDDAGGVFSLPSGGNIGNVNGPGSGSRLVRAVVSAETNYTGTLRADATYTGGGSDVAFVELQARGHHPVPILRLITTEIDYGEVEIDYEFRQAVFVANDGDAALEFDIGLQDPADPDISEFTLDLGHKTIPPYETRYYEMTFHPTSVGSKELFLVLDNTNEEPVSTTHNVRLVGSGTEPIPLSTMLVIDRSGSMSAAAGDAVKIEAARDAGVLYTEIIEDAWDHFGLTKFNESTSTPVTLDAISSNRANAQTILADIGSGGELYPDGGTGIGGAMEEGSYQFASSPAGNAQAMIVLTDGKENEEPWIANALPGIRTAYPDLKIFCVGIGDPIETCSGCLDGVEASKLQAIADDTDALFRVISTLSGEHRYDLEAFYFKAFAKATGRQLALDPMYFLALTTSLQFIAEVNIVECDRDAYFLVVSDLFKIPDLHSKLYLEDPTGQIIEAGSSVGGISVHVKTFNNCKLIKVKFPPRAMSHHYAGYWRLFLQPISKEDIPRLDKYLGNLPSYGGNVALAFMASVGSDYRLEADLTSGEVLVGEPVHIMAKTTEAWWPIPGATVTAKVTRPNGSVSTVGLFDDGMHGDGSADDAVFGVDYVNTSLKGYYDFFIRSVGVTERGESVTREITLGKYIGKKLPDKPPERECIPCWLLRLILIIILLLLILILVWLIRCCYRFKQMSTRG
ncbi:MAG: VWA domain-containing protein [candidate division Zixibacteria bacterium]|nr:VWA domain-containing protein [candidate division Zixibacteria bacterium]